MFLRCSVKCWIYCMFLQIFANILVCYMFSVYVHSNIGLLLIFPLKFALTLCFLDMAANVLVFCSCSRYLSRNISFTIILSPPKIAAAAQQNVPLPPDKHAFPAQQTCRCRPTNMPLPPDNYAFAARQTCLCRPTNMPLPPHEHHGVA